MFNPRCYAPIIYTSNKAVARTLEIIQSRLLGANGGIRSGGGKIAEKSRDRMRQGYARARERKREREREREIACIVADTSEEASGQKLIDRQTRSSTPDFSSANLPFYACHSPWGGQTRRRRGCAHRFGTCRTRTRGATWRHCGEDGMPKSEMKRKGGSASRRDG